MNPNERTTGRMPEMLQDCDRKLSRALSNTPDARLHAREAAPRVEGWVEAGLVCQACAGDAPRGNCLNPRCIGGPIVREVVPACAKGTPE